MKNIIALKLNCYQGYDLDTMLKGAKEAGFKYLEITASPGNSSGITRFESFASICEAKKKFEKYGLKPLSLGGHTNIMDLDLVEDFKNNLELAKFFGCKYFVCSVGISKKQTLPTDEEVAKNIIKYLPDLERLDLTLVLELHSAYNNAQMHRNILKLVNSDRVFVNYDAGNAISYGLLTNDQIIKDFNDNIDIVGDMHLKDKLGEPEEWNYPAVGKGYVPYQEIFKIIKEKNKDFPMTVEIEFTKDGPKDLEEIQQAVVDSYNYLKESGFNI